MPQVPCLGLGRLHLHAIIVLGSNSQLSRKSAGKCVIHPWKTASPSARGSVQANVIFHQLAVKEQGNPAPDWLPGWNFGAGGGDFSATFRDGGLSPHAECCAF